MTTSIFALITPSHRVKNNKNRIFSRGHIGLTSERMEMIKLMAKERKALVRNIKKHKKRLYPERGGGNRLAKQVGVSPQLLSQWINGVRVPALDKLIALAEVFEISIQELCGRPEPDEIHKDVSFYDAVVILTTHLNKAKKGKKRTKSICEVKAFIDRMLSN